MSSDGKQFVIILSFCEFELKSKLIRYCVVISLVDNIHLEPVSGVMKLLFLLLVPLVLGKSNEQQANSCDYEIRQKFEALTNRIEKKKMTAMEYFITFDGDLLTKKGPRIKQMTEMLLKRVRSALLSLYKIVVSTSRLETKNEQ